MGARDRRETREWCFNYFRLGGILKDLEFDQRLCIGNFLCSDQSSPSLINLLKLNNIPDPDKIYWPLVQKIEYVSMHYPGFDINDIFPANDLVSEKLSLYDFQISLLKKPFTWIRIRKNYLKEVLTELNERKILFQSAEDPCAIAFPQNSKLDTLDCYEKGYFEIQDYSSQKTKEFMRPSQGEKWWDACAGSGGKSLLLKEAEPGIDLVATDVRANILFNYDLRMKKANHNSYTVNIWKDAGIPQLSGERFDGIVADVPCSGSGTWSRTPEWLKQSVFPDITGKYVPLQRRIVSKAVESLKKGFPLIYITCSVFRNENEDNIDFFSNNLPLRLEKCAYLEGYSIGADTLFAARMIKV